MVASCFFVCYGLGDAVASTLLGTMGFWVLWDVVLGVVDISLSFTYLV
jgi:hypothetical protein